MSRRDRAAERAGRNRADGAVGIGAASRTARNAARRVHLDVGRQGRREADGRPGGQFGFQRILVGRRVNLAEVVDAGVGLRGGTSLHEVRNRDGGEEADDGHNDHDFDEREARITEVFGLFHFVLLSLLAA